MAEVARPFRSPGHSPVLDKVVVVATKQDHRRRHIKPHHQQSWWLDADRARLTILPLTFPREEA